jgi:hypothetical protein
MSMQHQDSSANRTPLSPPDVAAARADEVAALRDIETNLPPGEGKAIIMDALTGKHDSRVLRSERQFAIVTSENPIQQARYDRFYAARRHRAEEQRREASIAAARNRIAVVVLVLGNPPNGTVAAVVRRRLEFPENVILLGPNATVETLGAAFAEFDRSRELTGDDFDHDQMIPVQTPSATDIDAKDRNQMDGLMAKLRKAPMQQVEGVGTVQAIATNSRTRRSVEFWIETHGVRSHYAP